MMFPPEIFAQIVHWLYQSGDKLTATRLLISHKNPELARYCKNLEQPVVFEIKVSNSYVIGLHLDKLTDITVDWGDGNWEDFNGYLKSISHLYAGGTYRIRIYARKLFGLICLNDISWFGSIGNVITSTDSMFEGSNINIPLRLDTKLITNMSCMFDSAKYFNSPLFIDTRNCTTMYSMFNEAKSFNREVNFDTSKCTDMGRMFEKAESFNQPVVFNTSKVEYMDRMFCGAKNFNQDVNFNAIECRDMSWMFNGAINFDSDTKFIITSGTNLSGMFYDAKNLSKVVNIDTTGCDTNDMFTGSGGRLANCK